MHASSKMFLGIDLYTNRIDDVIQDYEVMPSQYCIGTLHCPYKVYLTRISYK